MLYLIYGTNTHTAREKCRELTNTLLHKHPDTAFTRLTSENWSEEVFEQFLGGQGLFENKCLVVLDTLFSDADIKKRIIGALLEIAKSNNIFIVLEGSVDAKTLKLFTKHAQKVQEFALPTKRAEKPFNLFSLTDALGTRSKKQLWVGYQKALRAGHVPEEIHGVLFWQIKTILLASIEPSAQKAGLKPFVYSKARRFAQNFTQEELHNLSATLVCLYHDARRGIIDFGVGMETWVLAL